MPLTVPKEFSPLKCPKFNIAGLVELNNLEVATIVAQALQKELIYEFVDPNKDRPGHDRRYAIDASKLERELGWKPKENFESGLRKTVIWFLENPKWAAHIVSGEYQNWIKNQYT